MLRQYSVNLALERQICCGPSLWNMNVSRCSGNCIDSYRDERIKGGGWVWLELEEDITVRK